MVHRVLRAHKYTHNNKKKHSLKQQNEKRNKNKLCLLLLQRFVSEAKQKRRFTRLLDVPFALQKTRKTARKELFA